jgi:ankyrin repeat protein
MFNHRLLIESTDSAGRTPIFYAILGKQETALKKLLEAGTNVNVRDKWRQTALIEAVRSADEKIIRSLLDQGIDVNARTDKSALGIAIQEENEPLVQLLLDCKVY